MKTNKYSTAIQGVPRLANASTSFPKVRVVHGTAAGGGLIEPISDHVHYHVGAATITDAGSPPTKRQGTKRSCSTAAEWVQRNPAKLKSYRGKWIAVGKGGIVGSSPAFDTVFVQARNKGVHNPLVFKVPRGNMPKKAVSAKRR